MPLFMPPCHLPPFPSPLFFAVADMIINVEKHLAQRLAASIMREIDPAQTTRKDYSGSTNQNRVVACSNGYL